MDIPEFVTIIEMGVFWGCKNLSRVSIPDGVTDIKGSAFYNCYGLSEVIIPDSVKTIGDSAFQDCESLTDIQLPESIKYIGYEAFVNCISLKSAVFEGELETLGESAFEGCTELTEVTLPESLKEIKQAAFLYCNKLSAVNYLGTDEGWSNMYIGPANNPLLKAKGNSDVVEKSSGLYKYNLRNGKVTITGASVSGDVIIPSELDGYPVVAIGCWAFANKSGITSVVIPDSVLYIDFFAFYNCSGLKEITLSQSLWHIGEWAFSGCEALNSLTVSESVEVIGKNAFANCFTLEKLKLGSSVKLIKDSAFYACKFINDVEYAGNKGDWARVIIEDGNGSLLDFVDLIKYDQSVSVTIDGIEVTYLPGETIQLSAQRFEYDAENDVMYICSGWNIKGVDVEDASALEITFIVPENDVVINKISFVHGDISEDGFVNAKDSLTLKLFVANIVNCGKYDDTMDLNFDGIANAKDLLVLKKILAGVYSYN